MPDYNCDRPRLIQLFGQEQVDLVAVEINAEIKAEQNVDPEYLALLSEWTKNDSGGKKFAKLECVTCDSMPCRFCELCAHKRVAGKKHKKCNFCTDRNQTRQGDNAVYHCEKNTDRMICERCNSCKRGCKCIECPNDKCKKKFGQEAAGTRVLSVGCQYCYQPKLWCEAKQKWGTYVCGDCERIDLICTCGAVMNVNSTQASFHRSNTFKVNVSRRYISAEIEVCGFNNTKIKPSPVMAACKKYGSLIHDDGSLPRDGKEINTAPANGDMLLKILKETYGAINQQEGWVNEKAGSHIHINAHDLTGPELQRVALVFAALEDTLFTHFAPDRVNNTYCEKTGKTIKELFGAPEMVLEDGAALKRMIEDDVFGGRYHSLNFESYPKYNTFECRMLGPNIDYDTMARWCMIWGDIFDFAIMLTTNEAKGLAMFQRDGDKLLAKIIRNKSVREWFNKKAGIGDAVVVHRTPPVAPEVVAG
jgi:hypothetical protein